MIAALKLLLVPTLLAIVTLAGRRWGQRVAGWLGSFPIVAGPILLILTLENGGAFGAAAAQRAMAGVAATTGFFVTYSHLAPRWSWWSAFAASTALWIALAAALSLLPTTLGAAAVVALAALALAPFAMRRAATTPALAAPPTDRSARAELLARMLAGGALVLVTSGLGARFGPEASGYAALFPVVGGTAAGFNHARQGAAAALNFLQGTNRGMWSVAVFCGVLALGLARWPTAAAFGAALAATVLMHALTLPRATDPPRRSPRQSPR